MLTGHRQQFPVTFDDAFVNVMHALPLLEQAGARATVFACAALADDGSAPLPLREVDVPAEAFATLRWDGLAELVERGVEVGSHTLSHPHLRELSAAELEDEVLSSRQRLEDHLGVPCRIFAYPFGESDRRVRAAVRKAGYECAFGLPGDTSWSDPFNLPRVGVWRKDGFLRFAMKTSAAFRGGRRLPIERDLPFGAGAPS
jgi:peptidoglycan/xylan/chitin deacetylase (PgdA/CDA1 family)